MKNLILLIAIGLTLCCCSNDDDNNNGETLPPATQTGANTVGCLVNGEVFLPKSEGINPAVVCNYEYEEGEFYFNLVFSDLRGTGVKTVSVRTSEIALQADSTYSLDQDNTIFDSFIGGGGLYGINATNYFYTNSANTGELTITRLDLSNSIISGTFWFDAINDKGDIVEIREGRFDYQY
ncbi:hypothetical protein SAMN05444278_10543 [Psychroflexus salarius]|uniref:Uncharacterized protein n=1 Tax=Psychroflexus salarius TaxID=1155689 RepID=A0A1M4W2L6_9FLAO|nr:DUF6252 family protein [Psychroflexus salarius]SHE75437.1 hypothetical protein SAMN05444278_10543 [Psychroflexus salarius]